MGGQYAPESTEETWNPNYKTIYEYTSGVLTIETRLTTDYYGAFLNSTRLSYEYQNNNLISVQYTGVDDMYEWLSYIGGKEDYMYDDNNNLERFTFNYRMDETSDWILDVERDNSYDNQFSGDDLIIPSASRLNQLNYRHMLLTSHENNYGFETNVIYVPKYNPVMVEKVKSIVGVTTNVYPNPTKDNITISWEAPYKAAEITIYDMTGSLVKRFQINNNYTIPVTDLSNGLHLYTLTSDGNVIESGKFVVTK